MAIETHRGLRLEVTSRSMSGPLVPGRPPRQVLRYLLTLPAAMVLVMLLVPMAVTTVTAFDTGGGHGFDNFTAIWTDPGSFHSLVHTVLWVGVALGVALLGFGLALVSRTVERWWLAFMIVLVLPFGASSLASGAAFRLLFDPAPERGTASAVVTAAFGHSPIWLGPRLVWIVLVLSFAWTWLGFAVSLFRAGLRAVPSDVLRRARVEGAGRMRELATTIRMVRPVGSIILLTLVVAAARVFDLVLIAAPGPMQDEVDTVAVHWWRLTAETPDDPGRPAALAVASFCLLGVLALLLSRAIARQRTIPKSPPRWWRSRRRDAVARGWSIVVGTLVSLLCAFPVVVLVATALHSPTDAGAAGWWHAGGGPSLESVRQSSDAGLVGALVATLAVALGATSLVMIVALFAAPALALS
ncbi:MAG TPA: sugar ABC transporter permease, partial [Actinopolymorphaceae bacterium]|nr:sugar ABC transporter permease [Actinopolymorphaceae bacterium]